jgi:magnesium transporter
MPVIIGSQSEAPRTGTLHFALSSSLLITLRDGDSHAVRSYASRILSDSSQFQDPSSALVHLVQSFVARLADISEIISHDMEQVSRLVFHESLQRSKAPGRGKPDSWRKVLQGLGKTARLNHRLLATLSGIERMTAFASLPAQQEWIGKHHAELAIIQRDLRALADQANAMVNEATFLLDAIVGAISIEQNNVIKIFSMVAVILMPPTMVASIYGMNFAHMPELDWLLGYPAALALMVLSGWLPWHWFRRNGWF